MAKIILRRLDWLLMNQTELAPCEYDLKAVGDNDILIDILYAGICHSDVEIIDNVFDIPIRFPYVSGH